VYLKFFLVGIFAASCSDSQCRAMNRPLAALFCGGQGTDAPGPVDPPPAACADLSKQAPALFALLNDPGRPLDALRASIGDLNAKQCFDPQRTSCRDDLDCHGAACEDGTCACLLPYNALGEVLRAGLRGLSAAAAEPPESAARQCVSIADAARLAQPNHLCELRRAWSVLSARQGGPLSDPRIAATVREVADYASGKADGVVHAALPGTFGRMARHRELCDPADFFSVLEKLLARLNPQLAGQSIGVLDDLVLDHTLRPLLLSLAAGQSAQGRDSVIFLVHFFITEISAVRTGAEASAALQDILDKFVYPAVGSDVLKQHLQAAADLLSRAIADDVGAFPALQRLVACAADPAIDLDPVTKRSGEAIGAVYDLLVQPSGVSVTDELDLLTRLVTLDQDGQVVRAAHGLVAALANDEQALDAVRAALAEALCGPEPACSGTAFAQGMLPAVATLAEHGALQDLFTLLSDVLEGCGT
jgi:hypothetical protein